MKIKPVCFAALFALVLAGCAKDEADSVAERYVFAMDTEMTLKAYGNNAEKALDKSEAEIIRLDKSLARGSADSEIYRVNAEGGGVVSGEAAQIIQTALDISASTDGAFDITVAPVMDLWGFYTQNYHVPSEAELNDALGRVDYKNIALDGSEVKIGGGSQIDLGGIAKGYLSSRIMEIMLENGVKSGIISLGGNVHTLGTKPDGSKWRVAIQDPFDADNYVCVLSVSDKAVITSGGYQRFFEKDGVTYHHIIDPSDGFPAENGLKSVSIISDNGAMADGLSTALFVMGRAEAEEYIKNNGGFDAVLVTDDGGVVITEGIEKDFECSAEYSVINK